MSGLNIRMRSVIKRAQQQQENPGPTVLQHGSIGEGEVVASVQMEYKSKQLQAALLVDTGCDMDINISEYKAAQLGLPVEEQVMQLEMGQAHTGQVQRRGVVKTVLLLEGEGSTVIQDPMQTSYLEVYTDVGTADPSNGTTAITNLSHQESAGASPPALTIRVLSPIRKGKDKKGFDAILGSRGMHRLRLGINKDTGRLYVKRRIGHRL